MVRPIDAVISLTQVQTALEMLHSAQREAALAQLRHEIDTEKTKDRDDTTVTREEEAHGQSIRDEDPRRGRQRNPKDERLKPPQQDLAPEHIDIVV